MISGAVYMGETMVLVRGAEEGVFPTINAYVGQCVRIKHVVYQDRDHLSPPRKEQDEMVVIKTRDGMEFWASRDMLERLQ